MNNVANQIKIIWGLKLIQLGRRASGNLINSFSHHIIQTGDFSYQINIMALDYWRVVEYGVAGDRIPFDASRRSGKINSDYINGLINWLKIKGVGSTDDVVRGIAFAIATKQTSKGGWGLGNPMDKNKLGFVRKTIPEVNAEVKKISKGIQNEVVKILNDRFFNFEIII